MIWEVVCEMRGAEVRGHVPDGSRWSSATEPAIAYLRRIAGELARLPHRYGFDPDSLYTVRVQTWDRAVSPERSLAFGREARGHEAVGLIPDPYYTGSDGFAHLYAHALRLPAWARRGADVAWRGSVTGKGDFHHPADIPRVRLAQLCRDIAGTDVKLIGVHETMEFPREPLNAFLRDEHLLGDKWRLEAFALSRFAIDIDGHANAWGLLEKLILGCCVLKVATPYEQWFYPRLHAWEHYVPVAADLSDLAERIAWCRDNDAECAWIAANGSRLAATHRLPAELPRSCLAFMAAAEARRG